MDNEKEIDPSHNIWSQNGFLELYKTQNAFVSYLHEMRDCTLVYTLCLQ